MMRLGLKYGRVSQEISVNGNFGSPSPPIQLHTACYCPITYATAAAYASSSSMLRRKSMSSLSLPLLAIAVHIDDLGAQLGVQLAPS